jgi:putative membrane protein
MIQYDDKVWFSFLFNLRAGQLRRQLPNMGFIALFTAAICYLDLTLALYKLEMPLTVHTLLGVVLGLVLVFRTNTAYERWWEGRRLFGTLVNASRSLALKSDAFLDPNAFEERHKLASLICAFARSVPSHLRSEISESALESFDEAQRRDLSASPHLPLAIAKLLGREMHSLRSNDKLSAEQFLTLSQNYDELINAIGGMERIKKTPIPFSYSMLIKRFIAAYLFTLPFGLVHDFGWASVIIVPFVFYVMVGIEMIAEIIENPFGKDEDDLPTDDIAENIVRNVKDLLNAAYGDPVRETVEGKELEALAPPSPTPTTFST